MSRPLSYREPGPRGSDGVYISRMLIKAYGLFWRADEVWHADRGTRELLGYRGERASTRQVGNFWQQQGLYVLYNNYGPYYVGLVRDGTLGTRLRTYWFRDRHAGNWDRFSWFGFRAVMAQRDEKGLQRLKLRAERSLGTSDAAITDIEALLIRALGTGQNLRQMRFRVGRQWQQLLSYQREEILEPVVQRRRRIR